MADERVVRIRLDPGNSKAVASSTNNSIKQIGTSADGASGSLLNMSKVATAVISSLATAKVIAYADAWTNVNNRIKAATTGSKEFSTAQEAIISISQKAGVEISGVADAYSRIAQSTAELGISQERVIDVTEKLTLALKAGGATGSETSSVMIQLGQALGSGALQGDELRSILEASIPITKALAKEFNATTGELKTLGSEGKLTSERVVQAIENMDASALTFTKDISSGFTEVNNALTVYVGKMDESLGASEQITGVISGLAENIDLVVDSVATLIQLGLAFYLTNLTKAVVANTVAFTANYAQIIRYQSALVLASGGSRVAAASTWALTYAMRALKAALPFGIILLGLEVLQNMLMATNDQIEANDRYAESTRKLNARLETRAEKEAAIALRTAAEVNAKNQDKVLAQEKSIAEAKLKIEQANSAKLAEIRGDEYDAADKLSLYQITKTQNRIKVMEEEKKRLQAIANDSKAAFDKIQASIGGKASKDEASGGGITAKPADLQGVNSGLDSFLNEDNVFSGSSDSSKDTSDKGGVGEDLTAKLQQENQMISDSLLARKNIYSLFYADANDLEATEYERQTAALNFNIATQMNSEAEAFNQRLQAITDRQLVIAENKSLNDEQKNEAKTLLDEQAIIAREEFEGKINQIAQEGAATRAQIEQQEASNKISTYQSYANTALSLASSFGAKSEKDQKKLKKVGVVVDTAAGISRAFAENPWPVALGISAGIAANGIAQIQAINSATPTSGITSGAAPSTASSSATSTASTYTDSASQPSQRIVNFVGLENFGDDDNIPITKSALISLLSSDEDVIVANSTGTKQGQRVGAI